MTNEDSKPPQGGRVFIVVYGSKKKSDEIKLYAPDPNNKTFEPGNIDKFQVSYFLACSIEGVGFF